VRFWTYVVAALQTVEPDVGEQAQALLQEQAPAQEAIVATLLNDLHALDHDVTLVLDDLHDIQSREIHDALAFAIGHLPANVHLVLATREDPPLPLASLRARGDLAEVRAADLRFTAEETAAYLNGAVGLHLEPEQIDALEARTEGWITALQLAGLSLQGRTGDQASGFISEFAGGDRLVLDYLVGEVLDRQPADTRDFLLQTSILGHLTGPLCDAVTGEQDEHDNSNNTGTATLEQLDRANLFLVALDDRRTWYRYHHLFAGVLQVRLRSEQPDLVPTLHRRASDWFAANGDRPEAIEHALKAGDVEQAATLIELASPALRLSRQEA
ncbi:helix-turn-helix transcriptional regulator, partial [cyanobacterium TDX16]